MKPQSKNVVSKSLLKEQDLQVTFFRESTTQQTGMLAKSLQSCLTLRNLTDYSLPGSSIHGILQVRTLENFFLQRIFATQGSNLHLLGSSLWQVSSLPLAHLESPLTRQPWSSLWDILPTEPSMSPADILHHSHTAASVCRHHYPLRASPKKMCDGPEAAL